jgi:D-3-phosphoglycerate dehydrogenase / 2-oxoglutarate reductase
MRNDVKRVFYVRYVAHPDYLGIVGKRPDVQLDKLENDSPDAVAEPIIAAAHAYQIGSARDEIAPKYHVTRELLARMPNLLVVSTNGAGYDTVDVKACTAAGVLVVNQTGGNREAVAQHVLGMMLCLAKRVVETDRALRRGTLGDRNLFMGRELQGRTIGIVGLGNVGRRIAEMCRFFGMQVLAYDPYLSAETIAARNAVKVELDELLRRSDFVSANCPLTDETRAMFGAREFALMQPHAYFITSCRGFIHDEAALLAALKEKRIAGAGLDVWDKEPPGAAHPLLQLDNVIATPHTAGLTPEARTKMGRIAAEQLLDCLDGKRPPRLVNPEVWPAYADRFARAFGFATAA